MSWPELSVRHHKQQTDCAISRAYLQLASDPPALEKFRELLNCTRQRANRLFEAPVQHGHHPGIDALVNLSRFHTSHIRPARDWPGTTLSWRPAVSSLAHHLVCKYTIPPFLASSWYTSDPADKKRNWVVAHSRGASFRSLDLPIVMTRKMEHIFLASPDHLPLERALRNAELLALGVPAKFIREILKTRLAHDLQHGDFWRTVWLFLIANADDVDPAQIGPMIDYIQAIRHDRIRVETQDGTMEFNPPLPAFSIKGRTANSMLRRIQAWHRSLGETDIGFSWIRSPFHPLLLEEQSRDGSELPIRWHMMELTSSGQLRSEGAAMRHCVASYAYRCHRGASSIWSLRLLQGDKIRHLLTIEVDPKRRAVIQARGKANRNPGGKPLSLLQNWAGRENLQMAI